MAISGAATGSYAYDTESSSAQAAHNRRVKQTLDGTLIHRDNVTTGETTDYLRLGQSGPTLVRLKTQAGVVTPTYTHNDHLGSASMGTSAGGSILWFESYTPFGEPLQTPLANEDNQGHTGHIHDTATGLTYMQARYYDPVIGRFLSNDPVGFADRGWQYFNRYAYTANDPVNMVDPDGEQLVPADERARQILNTAMNDPNSTVAQTHALAQAAGIPVAVQTGGQGANNSQVVGGITQSPVEMTIGGGQQQTGVLVTIDERDTVIVSGVDTSSGQSTNRQVGLMEIVEHELGNKGHAAQAVRQQAGWFNPFSFDDAVRGADEYRQKSGIPFERQTHTPAVFPTQNVP